MHCTQSRCVKTCSRQKDLKSIFTFSTIYYVCPAEKATVRFSSVRNSSRDSRKDFDWHVKINKNK